MSIQPSGIVLADQAAVATSDTFRGPLPQENTYRWASVLALTPSLSIRLDGDMYPLPMIPENLAGGLRVGDRVWCQLYGRRVFILGKAGGGSPARGAWVPYDADWRAADNTDIGVGTGGSPLELYRYKMIAPFTMVLRITVQWGATGGNGGVGQHIFRLPPGYAIPSGGEQIIPGKGWAPNNPAGNVTGWAYIPGNSNQVTPYVYTSAGNANIVSLGTSGSGTGPLGWYPNGNFTLQGTIEVAQEW